MNSPSPTVSFVHARAALVAVILSLIAGAGCATPPPGAERGPQGTIAYHVSVESIPPGAVVEVNNDRVGTTPLTLKIFGDSDGTFHNFGNDSYIVRANPPIPDRYSQTKIYKTGAFSIKDDRIPEKILFDFTNGNNSAK